MPPDGCAQEPEAQFACSRTGRKRHCGIGVVTRGAASDKYKFGRWMHRGEHSDLRALEVLLKRGTQSDPEGPADVAHRPPQDQRDS